jgi:hypothetical protein
MLQTVTMHYDIGKLPNQKDYVGIASSHPYAICAVLRVFGRGIEALPSKPDWEKNPSEYPHTPLPSARCNPIMEEAPVDYICGATLLPSPNTLIADTDFFVHHGAPNEALLRVVHSMNKQVPEPWEWLFGDLHPGCEYMCILEYRHDPEYTMEQRICDRSQILSEAKSAQSPAGSSTIPSSVRYDTPQPPSQPSSTVNYAECDRYLLDVPSSCRLDPRFSDRTHLSLYGTKRKRIYEAKMLIATHITMLPIIMGAKSIPDNLRQVYSWEDLPFPLPEFMRTWDDFVEYAEEVFRCDLNLDARLLILRAIHFQELLEENERRKKERAKQRLEDAKAKKKEEERRSAEVQEKRELKPLTSNGMTAIPKANPESEPATSTTANNTSIPKPQIQYRLTPMPSRKPQKPKSPPLTPQAAKSTSIPSASASAKPRATSKLNLLSPFRRSASKQAASGLPVATTPRSGKTIAKPSGPTATTLEDPLDEQATSRLIPAVPTESLQSSQPQTPKLQAKKTAEGTAPIVEESSEEQATSTLSLPVPPVDRQPSQPQTPKPQVTKPQLQEPTPPPTIPKQASRISKPQAGPVSPSRPPTHTLQLQEPTPPPTIPRKAPRDSTPQTEPASSSRSPAKKPQLQEPTLPPSTPRRTSRIPMPQVEPTSPSRLQANVAYQSLCPEMTPPVTPTPLLVQKTVSPTQAPTPLRSQTGQRHSSLVGLRARKAPTPHYMTPTTGSTQRNAGAKSRYKTSSPHLFFSDDESDEDRSNIPGLRFPRNSGDVLGRGRLGMGDDVR